MLTNNIIDDFYNLENNNLKLKYEYLGSGIEGTLYKVSSNTVAKKFHILRDKGIIDIALLMNSCMQTSFYSPTSFLFKDDSISTVFCKYFDGNNCKDINDVDFDILIPSITQFIKDIEKISLNGVVIKEGSIMLDEKSMVCVDTTMFDSINYKNNYHLYNENLKYFFYTNNFLNINFIDELKIQNSGLKELYFDIENLDCFYIELKKTLDDLAQKDVKTINEGIKLIKK